MEFRHYQDKDYQLLCDFLIEVNKVSKEHINWNWARLEWMIEHPYFDKTNRDKFGLWFDKDKLVALTLYDQYFGEATCITLKGYEDLFEEVINYAYRDLKNGDGLGIAINNKNKVEITKAIKNGFVINSQKETMMSIILDHHFNPELKDGFRFIDFNPQKDVDDVQWVIYQGFDHGNDKEEFLKQKVDVKERVHANPYLNLMIETKDGEKVAYCSMWYDSRTEYAYLEPLCVIPQFRKLGLAKAIVYQLFNRCIELGAKKAYVLSDMEFYKKLGFKIEEEYTFYWKK